MKNLTLALLATAFFTGCQAENNELTLTHLSTMQNWTNGVVLNDDGQTGHAAMNGTTCSFDTLNGWLIGDYNLPTKSDRIVDTLGEQRVGITKRGVHVFDAPTGWDESIQEGTHFEESEVFTAILVNKKTLGSVHTSAKEHGGCEVSIGNNAPVEIDEHFCSESTQSASDRDGTLLISDEEGTIKVTKDHGVQKFGLGGELMAYDGQFDVIYLATKGGYVVTATNLDGDIIWEITLDHRIRALDDMGDRAGVMVMTRDSDGGGEIVIIDGEDGEVHTRHPTPAPTDDLSVSEDGSTVALVVDSEVYFYDITTEEETPKKRDTLGENPKFQD